MLTACRVSSGVDLPAGGVVHSVFVHAVNIIAGDGLFSVVTPSIGAVPNGLLLREEVDLTGCTVAGDPVTCDGASLSAGGLRIDLGEATRWDPKLTLRGQVPC